MAAVSPVLKPGRINISLSAAAREEVSRLAKTSSCSVTDLVRLSLSLLKVVLEEMQHGNKLIVTTSGGQPVKELVIPRW